MKKWQKINHFPGMSEICRKDALARNMNRMLKLFPKEYNIFPKTWILPADWGDLQQYARQKKNRTYILKPDTGCQGKGIWITKTPREIKATENVICQTYISRPFLIDGFKFDLRLYVLVTSIVPLRIFVFKDGLARFTTQPYREPTAANVSNVFMHLTNYAIQKHSDKYVREDEEAGTKRRITTVNCWLIEHGYDVDMIWHDIDDVIIKVLMSGLPVLRHNYKTCFPNHVETSACFEILGFDIMLDRRMRPYVIEVNHSPSFHTDSQLDKEIKEALIWDTLKLANFDAVDRRKCIEEDKRRIRQRLLRRTPGKCTREDMNAEMEKWAAKAMQYEDDHLGNFRRIYPCKDQDKYEEFINSTATLFTETASFKARFQHSKQLREEIRERKDKLETLYKPRTSRLRPESPGRPPLASTVKRRPSKCGSATTVVAQTTPTAAKPSSEDAKPATESDQGNKEPVYNSFETIPIDESEENERCMGMEKRAVLLRSLGIVDAVYRLLSGTPGVEPISTLPKRSNGDHEKTKPHSLAKPVDLVLPECQNASSNNMRMNFQSANELRRNGLLHKMNQSNNSRSSAPAKPARHTMPVAITEFVMPGNLPGLGMNYAHPRPNYEPTMDPRAKGPPAGSCSLPPGMPLASLGVNIREAQLNTSAVRGQSVPRRRTVQTNATRSLSYAAGWHRGQENGIAPILGCGFGQHRQALLSINDRCAQVRGGSPCRKSFGRCVLEISNIPPPGNRTLVDKSGRSVSLKTATLYSRLIDGTSRFNDSTRTRRSSPPRALQDAISVKQLRVNPGGSALHSRGATLPHNFQLQFLK
uniref:SAM domain-containing protein n=1 Tax=Mesocestoides corti TaxID=53468 RepID=A0A5K3F6D2_MESCO